MAAPNEKPRVILRHCESYDADRIHAIVREGLEALDLRPRGRTLIKPNVVIAHKEIFPHAFTRPEFIDGVLGALRDRDGGEMAELAVGERCGITMPTRMAFSQAGYYPIARKHRAKVYHFDEVPQAEVRYTHAGRMRDYVFTPEPIAKCDFLVNCPKFKAHPWTTVTFSLKNYIGIQDDRHRLIDHDHRLDEKIADLQAIIQPKFIAIDAIIAGQGRMLTPIPFDLKLIIMGNNSVAVDAVCCRIIGLEPKTVDHIRIVSERGFGPIALEEISVEGDVTLDQARARAKGFKVGLVRVEKYFEGTRIRAYAGPPPEPERTSYCWGGCPGAMEEAIEIIRQLDEKADAKMKPFHVVFGAYKGPIDAKPGEKVVFIGDCANWKGRIAGKDVEVGSVYKDRRHKDPYHAKFTDIFIKMAVVFRNLLFRRKQQVMRAYGCPVSVAEQALYIAGIGGTKNPYFAPATVFPFIKNWLLWRMVKIMKQILGMPYQKRLPSVPPPAPAR
ncbi:MAG: DUF362 domain-containing protein [Nitrospirae bacterium]|nr:DUF362 domain-containing protein [Nitrospirota bacterium]